MRYNINYIKNKLINYTNSYGVNIIILILSFITTKLIIGTFGAESFGKYGYIIAISGYIQVFSSELQDYTLLSSLSKKNTIDNNNEKIYNKNIIIRLIYTLYLVPIGIFIVYFSTKELTLIILLIVVLLRSLLPEKILDLIGKRNIALKSLLYEKIFFVFGIIFINQIYDDVKLDFIIIPTILSIIVYYISYRKNYKFNVKLKALIDALNNKRDNDFLFKNISLSIIPLSYMMMLGFVRVYSGYKSMFIELSILNILYSISNYGTSFFNIILRGTLKEFNKSDKESINRNIYILFKKYSIACVGYSIIIILFGKYALNYLIGDSNLLIENNLLYLSSSFIIICSATEYINQISLITFNIHKRKIYMPITIGAVVSLILTCNTLSNSNPVFYTLIALNISLFITLVIQIFTILIPNLKQNDINKII